MPSKTLFTGKTRVTNGAHASARSADGFLDIALPQPHPAAENLFGAAWSACYLGAIELAAARRKITLPQQLAVDAEIDLQLTGAEFSIGARLQVSMPGIDRDLAQQLIHAAHDICPYSKATRGNIVVETHLV